MTWTTSAAAARDALLAADPDRGVVVRDRAQRLALYRCWRERRENIVVCLADWNAARMVVDEAFMPEAEPDAAV